MSNVFQNAIYLDDVQKDKYSDYIGNGYRSICYTLNHDKQGTIVLFGYDKADNPKTFIIPWNSYIKYTVKYQTEEKDIYDRYVAIKEFKNIFERKKYIENCPGLNIVECLRPEQEFSHFMFDHAVFEEGFNTQPLRIHYFDIETEISDQFEKPADARNRINMMTIYDTETEKFYTWTLLDVDIDFTEGPVKDYPKDKFVLFKFHDNEEKMLKHFLDWMENNYADVNVTWNGRAYDIPYLTRRIENVLGKEDARRLSPVHKYFIKEVNHDNKRADQSAEIEVDIDGLFIADALVLYRDKFGISKPDGGFTLDNIGEVEGCGHKVKYTGTLKDLYLNDPQLFFNYNVMDVDLLKRIEEKCKMINLARTITSFGLCSYMTIYSSIPYLIGSVISFAKTKMGKVMCSYLKEKSTEKGFEGAFVFPTQQGLYKDGIACIDFASLYPSNIRSINASPETYVGKVLVQYKSTDGSLLPINEKDELFFDIFDDKIAKAPEVAGLILKLANGQKKPITLDKLRAWIEKKGIYTTNNTIFLKHEVKWGVIAKWCEYFYNQRKATKKKMLALFHELTDHTKELTAEEKAQKEKTRQNLDSRQGAFKNMINSIYGQMGSAFSPISNLDIAQSITRQGRFCNTSASSYILKEFQRLYDKNYKGYQISLLEEGDPRDNESVHRAVAGVGGDTDSFSGDTRIFLERV